MPKAVNFAWASFGFSPKKALAVGFAPG